MRKRSPAKSALSSPPVPARISRKRFLSSLGIARQQHVLQVGLERGEALAARLQLVLREGAHLGILRHVLGGRDVALGLAVVAEGFDEGPDLGALLGELAVVVEVVHDRRGRKGASRSHAAASRGSRASPRWTASWLARGIAPFQVGIERLDRARERLALALTGARQRLRGMMQELVGEPRRERLEHLARVVAPGEAPLRLGELGFAVLVGAPAQLDDRGDRGARALPLAETLPPGARRSPRLRPPPRGRLSAPSCTIVAEVVDGVEEDVLAATRLRPRRRAARRSRR